MSLQQLSMAEFSLTPAKQADIEALRATYLRLSREMKEAESELNAAAHKETQKMACLIGQRIASAKYYEAAEGVYVLTLASGWTISFSASGDDMTQVTMSIEKVVTHG